MFKCFVFIFAAAILLAGCKPPPDPNDPADVKLMDAEVLMRNLNWSSTVVNDRVLRGEISDDQGKEILSKYANKLAENVDISKVIPQNAWQYGDVFRLAKRWDLAETVLKKAVDHAEKTKNEDRRINDLLHLAQVEAELGKIDDAIADVRETFSAPATGKAPILYAVLYEIVPAAEGKKRDADMAKLLEESIEQHNQVIVDPQTTSGAAFLAAKGHHLAKAWAKVIELYRAAGKDDLADAANKKAHGEMSNQRRL